MAWLIILGMIIVVAGAIALYTWISNYIDDRSASKRKVVFKTKNGKTRGYWDKEDGEQYDPDLKIEK